LKKRCVESVILGIMCLLAKPAFIKLQRLSFHLTDTQHKQISSELDPDSVSAKQAFFFWRSVEDGFLIEGVNFWLDNMGP